MKVLLQRVSRASVSVNGETIGAIGAGLLCFVGVAVGDTEAEAEQLASKVAGVRIFPDGGDKLNLSLRDVGGEALVVSQFTLLADARKGKRPSFTAAAPADLAEKLVRHFARELNEGGVGVAEGQFGAHMLVELVNDGPVTIMLEA